MSLEKSLSIEAGLQSIVPEQEPKNSQRVSTCAKIKMVVKNITVEPIMFCYILPCVMASITTQNLTLEKSCRVNLAFDKEMCDALSNRNESYPDYHVHYQQVQKLGANMAIIKNVIQSLLPALLLFFLGSWSDRNKKRKPPILNALMGEMTACICLLICTFFFYELPVQVNVLAEALPPGLAGGWFAMFMGVFSFISGVTTEESRTTRIGAVHLFVNISITVGISLGGVLYNTIGFYGVYSLALSMYFCGLFYGLFFVKDIWERELEQGIEVDGGGDGKKNFLTDFFDFKHVRDTLRVCFKKGEKNRRTRICVLMVLVMLIIGPMHGEMNIAYFFVSYKFGWDALDFSIFSTFTFIIHLLATIFALTFFTSYLKVDDTILGMLSTSSKIIGALFYAFAPTPIFFYIGAVAELLNGIAFIAMRSIVSKQVPADELGQINSLFGVAEAIIPLIYGPLYSKIYSYTIDVFPGAFYLTGGILTIPALFIFVWLYFEHRRDNKEDELNKAQAEILLKEKETNCYKFVE